MRKSSVKYEQVNEEIMRALADIIRTEVKDPRVPEITSVVAVEVTPDLGNCNAYISVFGDEEVAREALVGLNSATGYIRSRLAKMLNLRHTPEIRFLIDRSIAYGVDMMSRIDEVMEKDNRSRELRGEEE
ncbi:MAG: 30S ribosome-binding factor RbfA [Lachnospiraceae bacterium]|jgi:ribosome-binding factor A|nr:30S ribosome-binding factor RbfA [Lachnospiraceae bacterium]